MRQLSIVFAVSAALLLVAQEGAAQTTEGRVRLGAGLGGFTVSKTTAVNGDSVSGSPVTAYGVGFSNMGVDLGYGLGPGGVLGTRAVVQGRRADFGDFIGTLHAVQLGLVPYFEWAFLEGQTVRPTLGAQAAYTWTKQGDDSFSSIALGPTVGLLGFVAERVSVDVRASLLGVFSFQEFGGSSVTTRGYQVGLDLTLSGWLGGR
jgi:hypothetical protein